MAFFRFCNNFVIFLLLFPSAFNANFMSAKSLAAVAFCIEPMMQKD